MFAIVEIGNQQFKVTKGDTLVVKRLHEEEGGKVTLDKIYLLNNGETVKVGKPLVSGVTVEAKILQHSRGEKIRVFKMKPKKRYQKTHGHKDHLSEIEITGIIEGEKPTKVKKAPAKAKAAPKVKKKVESKES